MISKMILHFATISLIGIATLFHQTVGQHREIYNMQSDNSRPVPLSPEIAETKNTISMTIYYESLCPDSLDFFQNQLLPLLETLQKSPQQARYINPEEESNRDHLVDPLLDIHFIPYGKAVTLEKSQTTTFLCQHGPLECEGNRLHACTLDGLSKIQKDTEEDDSTSKTIKLVNFFVCTMKFLLTPQDRDEATPKANLKSNNLTSFSDAALDYCLSSELSNSTTTNQLRAEIESCLQQDHGQGSYLLKKNGELTHSLNPRLYFVPWITYNGIWSKKSFEDSRTDLKKVICSLRSPKTFNPLNDTLGCQKYSEDEQEQLKLAGSGVNNKSKLIRKIVVGDSNNNRQNFFESEKVSPNVFNRRDGRGVGGEFSQNTPRRIRRPAPKFRRDRRGFFLHGNNDVSLGGGGAAWRWRTNVHSNPGMEWRWRRPVAGMPH